MGIGSGKPAVLLICYLKQECFADRFFDGYKCLEPIVSGLPQSERSRRIVSVMQQSD